MLRHTTRVDKRVIVKPVNKIINDEIVTVRKDEFPLNVLVVTMQDKVASQDDVRELAAAIYPKALKAIGKDNYMAGVEIQLEDVIKVLLHKDDSLPAFEKAMHIENEDDRAAALARARVDLCIECACCSYVCPAHRPVMENNKQAKRFARKYNAAKKEGGK